MKKLYLLIFLVFSISFCLTACNTESPGNNNENAADTLTATEHSTEEQKQTITVIINNTTWKDYFEDDVKEKIAPVFDKEGKLESITCSYYLLVKKKYTDKIDLLKSDSFINLTMTMQNIDSYISKDGDSYKIDGDKKENGKAIKKLKNLTFSQNDDNDTVVYIATTNMVLHEDEDGKKKNVFAHYKDIEIKDVEGQFIIRE